MVLVSSVRDGVPKMDTGLSLDRPNLLSPLLVGEAGLGSTEPKDSQYRSLSGQRETLTIAAQSGLPWAPYENTPAHSPMSRGVPNTALFTDPSANGAGGIIK